MDTQTTQLRHQIDATRVAVDAPPPPPRAAGAGARARRAGGSRPGRRAAPPVPLVDHRGRGPRGL
jgi:hypothetical protein